MTSFIDFLNMLNGRKPMPVFKSASYQGEISEDQLHVLAEVITENKAAGGIRLEGCMLGDKGAQLVAEALQTNTLLHTVELPRNDIGDDGAQHILEMLCVNSTITTLDLSGNPCQAKSEVLWDIGYYLDRHRVGLGNTDMGSETPPPSSSKAGSLALGNSPFPTPAASLASWGRQSPSLTPATATGLRRSSSSPTSAATWRRSSSPPTSAATLKTGSSPPTLTPNVKTSPSPPASPASPTSSFVPARSPTPAQSPFVRSPNAMRGRPLPNPADSLASHDLQTPSPARTPALSRSPTPQRAVLQLIQGTENQIGKRGYAAKAASHASAVTQLDQRLHHMEAVYQAISTEVGSIKQETTSMATWKNSVDVASTQVASVLEDLEDQVLSIRSSQQTHRQWKGQVDAAGRDFKDSADQLRVAWRLMKERVDQLAHAQQLVPLQSVQEEQERQQHQIQDLIDDVAAIQKDQDFLAVETGVSVNLSGVDMWNRIVQLEKDCDHFQEVTDRLDKYVEEMLRKMFGTLDQGQCRLRVEVQQLAERVSRTEEKQTQLADQFQQFLQAQSQPSNSWQQSQDQVLHDVLRRLQRTEAALSLAYPSSAATLHQPSQQAPFALTQSNTAPQQHGSVYDSGSDCESETASEASLRHAIIQKAPHRHHRVSGLKLNSMQKSLSAAEAPHELSPVPAPRHQTFRSPAAVDHDQSTANLSSHSHSDYRSSSTHHAVFTGDQTQQTAATDMDEPEASSGVDLSKHTQDVKANWDRQPTASSATMSKPSSTSASGQVFHLQAIARTCDQSQASPSGQSAQKTFVTDRANAPLSGPSATEYSMQSAYDAVSVSPRQPTGSAAEQDDHRRTSTLQLQERLMTTTDNISNHKDTLAVQDSQYANVKTTTQCNRSMSDAGGSAGAMPRRFGSGFFRLRPDHNRFL